VQHKNKTLSKLSLSSAQVLDLNKLLV